MSIQKKKTKPLIYLSQNDLLCTALMFFFYIMKVPLVNILVQYIV